MPTIVATRTLQAFNSSKEYTVEIHRPKQEPKPHWRCGFRISGIGDDSLRFAGGTDSFDALNNAIRAVRFVLDAAGLPLTWLGFPYKVAFPLEIDVAHGYEIQMKLEHNMIVERDRLVKERIAAKQRKHNDADSNKSDEAHKKSSPKATRKKKKKNSRRIR